MIREAVEKVATEELRKLFVPEVAEKLAKSIAKAAEEPVMAGLLAQLQGKVPPRAVAPRAQRARRPRRPKNPDEAKSEPEVIAESGDAAKEPVQTRAEEPAEDHTSVPEPATNGTRPSGDALNIL
jgi:hypothetical protein